MTPSFVLPKALFFLLVSVVQSPSPVAAQDARVAGILEGRVLALPDTQPVPQARVGVVATSGTMRPEDAGHLQPWEVRTDQDGRFSLVLPPGRYELTVAAFGFEEGALRDVVVEEGRPTQVTVLLRASPFRLDEIVIAPSTFGMLRTQPLSGQLLTREELEILPNPGNDIIRAVARAPGVSTFDYSAKPMVQGARAEEVLTILDGLELIEPYHLKHCDGSLSIVDVELVSEVSLTTSVFR
jgi:hypothetical protein